MKRFITIDNVLAALLEREVSGAGQWLQTSLLQAQVFMLDFQAARWLVDHEVPQQAGNNHPTSIPTGVFETADGHMNIAVAGQAIWLRFCVAIGDEALAEDPAYATPKDRSKNRDALNAAIAAHTRQKTTAEWVELLNAAGVPAGDINTIDKVFADPQVRHLGMAQRVDSNERGPIELVGQPIRMSRTPSTLAVPPPTMGQHTEEVLAGLGYGAAEVEDLRAAGAV